MIEEWVCFLKKRASKKPEVLQGFLFLKSDGCVHLSKEVSMKKTASFSTTLLLVSYLLALSLATFSTDANASVDLVCFNKLFQRKIGQPRHESYNFPAVKGLATIKVYNGDGSGWLDRANIANVIINGKVIFRSTDFNKRVKYLQAQVNLLEGNNTVDVNLLGLPGVRIRVEIVQNVKDAAAAKVIGPEGGKVSVVDFSSPIYGAEIIVQPDTVETGIVFIISYADVADSSNLPVYPMLIRHSPATFKKEVTVAYKLKQVATEDDDFMVFYFDETKGHYFPSGLVYKVEPGDSFVYAKISHFSISVMKSVKDFFRNAAVEFGITATELASTTLDAAIELQNILKTAIQTGERTAVDIFISSWKITKELCDFDLVCHMMKGVVSNGLILIDNCNDAFSKCANDFAEINGRLIDSIMKLERVSLCDRIGEQQQAAYFPGPSAMIETKLGPITTYFIYDYDLMEEKVTIGGTGCLGRCGKGCPGDGEPSCGNKQRYTQACLNHDVCCDYYKRLTGESDCKKIVPCDAIFAYCSDDCFLAPDCKTLDHDSDGIPDSIDPDDDNDGMSDVFEIGNGLDPYNNDAGIDSDNDGYTNIEEYIAGTNPKDPNSTPGSKPGPMPGPNLGDFVDIPMLTEPAKIVLEQGGATALVLEGKGDLSRVDLLTGAVTTIVSGFYKPYPDSSAATDVEIEPNGLSALITKDSDTEPGQLLRADLSSGEITVISSDFVKPAGVALMPGGEQAIVIHQKDNGTVSRVNLETREVTSICSNFGNTSLSSIAIEPGGATALVGNWGITSVGGWYGGINRINLANGSRTNLASGIMPYSIVIEPNGTTALVALGNPYAGLFRMDLATGSMELVYWPPIPGVGTPGLYDVAVEPSGSSVLLAGRGLLGYGGSNSTDFAIYRLELGEQTPTVVVHGVTPEGIALETGGATVLVTQPGSWGVYGGLFRINLGSGITEQILPLYCPLSVALEKGSGTALVPCSCALGQNYTYPLYRVDLVNKAASAITSNLFMPGGVAIEAGGTSALVTEGYSNSDDRSALTRVDLLSGGLTRIVTGLKYPSGVVIEPDGMTALVTQGYDAYQLSRVDLSSGAVSLVAPIYPDPITVAIELDGTTALVTTTHSTEFASCRLLRVGLSTGDVTEIASGFMGAGGVVIESGGATALIATDAGIYRVRINPEH
jgi:DNA-binding beta-propeller fold protein YncE